MRDQAIEVDHVAVDLGPVGKIDGHEPQRRLTPSRQGRDLPLIAAEAGEKEHSGLLSRTNRSCGQTHIIGRPKFRGAESQGRNTLSAALVGCISPAIIATETGRDR